MPPSNGIPNSDRNPLPGTTGRGPAGNGERDRLDAAREHARKKILDRLIAQAMEDLQDPAVIEKMPIDVEGEAAKLAPPVMDAVKHRLMDRIANDVVEMISKGDAFREVVDEATRRTESQLKDITDRVVSEVTEHLGGKVADALSDTEALARRLEDGVDKESSQFTDVAHVVCGRIEESIRTRVIEMAGNADVTAEVVRKRIPDDHPALEAILKLLNDRLTGDLAARSLDVLADPESAAARALERVDRDSESLARVRELLSEQLLVMVMGDALDDLGRKLASNGPRDSMLDRVFQTLTEPGAGPVAPQPEIPAQQVPVQEPEPVAQPVDEQSEPVVEETPPAAEAVVEETPPAAEAAVPEPVVEDYDPEPAESEPVLIESEPQENDPEPSSPESVESIVSELEFEPVAGSTPQPEKTRDKVDENATHCYVYGVVLAKDWKGMTDELPDGVEEGTVLRAVGEGKLMAVVSDVPGGLYGGGKNKAGSDGADWTRTRLRRHARVLGQIGHAITVLPLPFGTVYPSESGVTGMLSDRAKEFSATLDRLAGRVEWTVRMVRDDYRMLERMVDLLDSDGMDLSSLPDDVAAELDTALAECEEPGRMMTVVTTQCVTHARAHLEIYADGSVDRRSSDGEGDDAPVLNRAYLVPREGAKAFRKALETLAAQWSGLGVGFEVSGPWPPYHFAEGSFD